MQRSLSGNSRFVSKPVSYIAITVAMIGLAACGGGGGGDNNPPPSGPSTQPPANTAPSVNAGADQTIQLPATSVDLQGSATDAENNPLTYTWTSSPADGVTFASASSAGTSATFTTAGTYTLTLTANDGTTTGSDTAVITVSPAAAGNTPPTVDAGADQTIQLPSTAALQATASDAESNTLTYAWTASPADGVTFADATAASTTATFTTAGAYTLTLTVNDGTNTVTDTTTVTVQGAAELAWPGVDPNDPATDPNHGWVSAAPADVGMDAARLVEAETYSLTGGGSGLVARHGKLVHKWGNIDQIVQIKSATKSIGSIALGVAWDQQLIALSDTAQSRYPNFGIGVTSPTPDPTPADPTQLAQITIQQLATHTAGFDKPGNSHVDLIAAPGTEWRYSDGSLNWLADTLTNVFQRDLNEVLTEKAWTPLNITTNDLRWREPTGDNVRPAIGTIRMREFASGITANANAMARVGLLFLRKGVWRDQRILSEAFINTVSTPQPETASAALVDPTGFPSANQGHGVMWWTNATKQLPDVPADAYWAWGLGDSLIVVIPSLDLVVARLGNNPDDPAVAHWRTRPGGAASWDGNYQILAPFLNPIVQSVTNPEL